MSDKQSKNNGQRGSRGYLMLLVGDESATSDAALGIALRGAGHNLRVHIIEFQKTGRDRGEVVSTSFLTGVSISQYGTIESNQSLTDVAGPGISPERAEEALREASLHVDRRVTNILILEGILSIIDQGVVEESRILDLIAKSASWLDIVATGSVATTGLKEACDSLTTMETVKSDSGIAELRPGIHY